MRFILIIVISGFYGHMDESQYQKQVIFERFSTQKSCEEARDFIHRADIDAKCITVDRVN